MHMYFVMPYIAGADMSQLLFAKKTLPLEVIRFYGIQILLAIRHLHDNDKIHRDIKPENVLIGMDGYIKLTDFGVASVQDGKTDKRTCHKEGTPGYMSPEVLLVEEDDEETWYANEADFWSFGIILYEMAVGQTPFHHRKEEKMRDKILESDWDPEKVEDEVLRDLISELL